MWSARTPTYADPAAFTHRLPKVACDRAQTRGRALTRIPMGSFDVQRIVAGDGLELCHYVSREGIVFATTWFGPTLPDLGSVLGPRYGHYAADVQAGTVASKVVSVRNEELVLQVVKLPGGIAGFAHMPKLVPAGVRLDDIH